MEAKSYWPKAVSRLFKSLNEIPWLSLTAISSLFGISILLFYFHSIDYIPSDFSAFVGLSAAATVCALALICLFALCLFAPASIYKQYASDEAASSPVGIRAFTEFELVALQLGGAGFMLVLFAYANRRDCGSLPVGIALFGFGLLLAWSWASLRIVLDKGSRMQRIVRINVSVAIAIFGTTLFLILMPVLSSLTLEYVDTS